MHFTEGWEMTYRVQLTSGKELLIAGVAHVSIDGGALQIDDENDDTLLAVAEREWLFAQRVLEAKQ